MSYPYDTDTRTNTFNIPQRNGYKFSGWSQTEDGAIIITSSISVRKNTNNTKVYAIWTPNSGQIEFDVNGGEERVTKTVYDNAGIKKSERDITDKNTEGMIVDTNVPYATKFYEYTVNNDGTINKTKDLITYTPSKHHYSFEGWIPELPATMSEETMHLEAAWEPILYSLTFDADGGKFDGTIDPYAFVTGHDTSKDQIIHAFPYNTQIINPVNPEKTSYIFMGWMAPNSKDATQDLPMYMPGEDRTYTAKWLPVITVKVEAVGPESIRVVDPDSRIEYRVYEVVSTGNAEDMIERIPWTDPTVSGDTVTMVFDGLTPDRTYVIFGRYKAKANEYNASDEVKSDQVKTPKFTQEAPDAPIGLAGFAAIKVISTDPDQEYYLRVKSDAAVTKAEKENAANWVSPDENLTLVFTGLKEGTDYELFARWKENEREYASEPSEAALLQTLYWLTGVTIPETIQVYRTGHAAIAHESAAPVTYQWYIDNGEGAEPTEIAHETTFDLIPGTDLFNKTVFVRATQVSPLQGIAGEETRIRESNKAVITRGKGYRAAAPVLTEKGIVTLTIQAKTGEEYVILKSKDDIAKVKDSDWIRLSDEEIELGVSTLTFTGLDDDTVYYIFARLYETPAYEAGDPSEALEAKTLPRLTGVKIDGVKRVFATLTAVIAPEASEDLTYQWYRDGIPIDGATELNYTQGAEDEGHDITFEVKSKLTYQWYRNGEAIPGATGKTYTLTPEDVDCEITVKVFQVVSDEETIVKESSVKPIDKAEGPDSEIPELDSKGTKRITIKAREDEEYVILLNPEDIEKVKDGDWKSLSAADIEAGILTLTFDGLTPNTTYYIFARKKETSYSYAGKPSEPLEATTDEVGTISAALEAGEGVPSLTMDELQAEELLKIALTGVKEAEERQQEGEDILLTVRITNIDQTVSEADKKLVQDTLKKKAADARDLLYLDISVYLKIGEDEEIRLTNLGSLTIGLTLTVPDGYKAPENVIRTYHLVRVHDNSAEILASSRKMTIPFSSGLFSTYGLGQTDEAVPTATPTATPSATPTTAPTATPKPTSVKTSDDSNMPLWIGMLCALVIGFIGFNVYRRKKR